MKTLVAFVLTLAAGTAESAILTLSWNGGPVAHPEYSCSRSQGPIATVVATATGFDQPVVAVQVLIRVRSYYKGMPDAWRFEPGGCADGGFSTPEIAIDPACPFLDGPNALRITRAGYSDGFENFVFAFAHDPVNVSPDARYTIAQFQFDMNAAFAGLGLKPDSCGCVEQPQAVVYTHASWLGSDGKEYPFFLTSQCLGWEDPDNSFMCPYGFICDLCGPDQPPPRPNPCADQQPTATTSRSWGAVKALYR